MSLKRQVASASKWSALSEIAAKGVTPIVFLMLAHLLSPEDFGVVAVAALVISFAQLLWDAGMSKALIQRAGDPDDAANVLFWINISLGLAVYLVFFIGASFIAQLFDDQRATAVVQVQGVQIIFMSVNAVHVALFQKNLDFKPLFWVRLTTSLVPGLASIPLALAGASYWALVIGTLSGSAVQTVLLWRLSVWRPHVRFDVSLARGMLRFGAWSTAEGLLGWFYAWGDTLVVGAILSAADLGLYRTGNLFVTMLFTLLLAPLQPVLFSAFSRLQHDKARLRDALVQSTRAMTLVAVPIGAGAFVLSNPLAAAAFGSEWEGIAQVLAWLGLMHGISWIVGANASAYRALGRPDVNAKITGFAILYYLPIYLFAAPYGLDAFVISRFAAAALAIPIHLFVAQRLLKLRWYAVLREIYWFLIASTFAAAVVIFLFDVLQQGNPLLKLSILSVVGLFVYVVVLLPEWQFVRHVTGGALQRGRIQ